MHDVLDRTANLQPGGNGAFCVVFFDRGIAEIGNDAVTDELGDMTLMTANDFKAQGLIVVQNRAVFFQIQLI